MKFDEMAGKLLDNLKACGGHWTRRMETSEKALRTAYVAGLEKAKEIAENVEECGGEEEGEGHEIGMKYDIILNIESEINKIKKES